VINDHLAQISDDRNPSNIYEACATPAFAKAADDKMKMITDFETFKLVPREEVPPDVTPHCLFLKIFETFPLNSTPSSTVI
jgi:hypothetical protein